MKVIVCSWFCECTCRSCSRLQVLTVHVFLGCVCVHEQIKVFIEKSSPKICSCKQGLRVEQGQMSANPYLTKICSFISALSSEDTSFETLKESVSEKTLKAISDMGFTHMTEIQHKSIAPLLNGRFVPSCEVTVQIIRSLPFLAQTLMHRL